MIGNGLFKGTSPNVSEFKEGGVHITTRLLHAKVQPGYFWQPWEGVQVGVMKDTCPWQGQMRHVR